MSAPPNWLIATSNILSSCAQSVTSVFWKTAFAPVDVAEYCETTASASGRRARSAKTTLQPFSRRSFAKQRLMPEPAPVTIAAFPSTFMAIVPCRGQGEKEKREARNARCLVARMQPAREGTSATYLYTSQARQTHRQSDRGVFTMMCLVMHQIPGWKEDLKVGLRIGARRLR